jgi:flagellar hook-associated protein 1 FlgK
MRSTFFGLEIGYRGLAAHQKSLDITGHNIANASTPGYSRQRGEITETDPFTYPGFNRPYSAGQIGTGVEVTSVLRIRDQLIDGQIQNETMLLGYWESRRDMLDQAELILNEPADSNIRTSVDKFWTALENLADDATSIPARSELRQQALAMTATIREDYAREAALRTDANQRIVNMVTDINKIATEIANLNDQIGKISALGDHPNDLMDKRDQLVEELSKMINIGYTTDSLNRIKVTVKGVDLVDGSIANKINTVLNPNDPGMVTLEWENPGPQPKPPLPVEVTSGNLKGLLEIRDQEIPKILNDLNNFASTLIARVNALHSTGYGLDGSTGFNFFKGTNAMDIDLADELQDETINPGDSTQMGLLRIACSDSELGLPGNSKIIEAIYELKHLKIMNANTTTIGDFLGTFVNDIAEKSSIAKIKADHQALLIQNLDLRRESISGVSMDEEMTNMVKFQQGYNAAAKIISTMDEMLDVVINKLKM